MYKKTTLENGLRVLTVPQPGNMATTVLVLVGTGSKYETKETNGVAHFLEHMCFKGTKKRPTAMSIATELDTLGAHYNAFTGQEYTGYYAKVEYHKGKEALEIVADLYNNPVFKAEEIEKEKGVIIQELNMYEDMPQRKIGDYFMDLLYGDQPAGWDIGGTKENIQALTRDDFVTFRKNHYVPEATTVIIAGNIDEDEMHAEVVRHFSDVPKGEKQDKVPVTESQDVPAVLLKEKAVDQTHLMLGVRAYDLFDTRRYALQVLGDILGGGMSSRLFHEVREELGAAYYVHARGDFYTDHGYFAVSAGVDQAKLDQVITVILKAFDRLKNELVTEEELIRAKSHLSGNLLLALESSDSLATFFGTQEVLRNEVITPPELLKNIEAVTREAIQKVAQDIFVKEHLNLALIGPHTDNAHFKKLLTEHA